MEQYFSKEPQGVNKYTEAYDVRAERKVWEATYNLQLRPIHHSIRQIEHSASDNL